MRILGRQINISKLVATCPAEVLEVCNPVHIHSTGVPCDKHWKCDRALAHSAAHRDTNAGYEWHSNGKNGYESAWLIGGRKATLDAR